MTVYRNLQEQVYENAKDIEELSTGKTYRGPYNSLDDITDLIDGGIYLIGSVDNYSIYKYSNDSFTYLGKFGAPGPQGPEGPAGNSIVSTKTISSAIEQTTTTNTIQVTYSDGSTSTFNVIAGNGSTGGLGAGTAIDLTNNRISVLVGNDLNTVLNKITVNDTLSISNGRGQSMLIRNYTNAGDGTVAMFATGKGSSAQVYIEASDDLNKPGKVELIGNTSITGTLKIGNTEITEEQLQRLLQLIA